MKRSTPLKQGLENMTRKAFSKYQSSLPFTRGLYLSKHQP